MVESGCCGMCLRGCAVANAAASLRSWRWWNERSRGVVARRTVGGFLWIALSGSHLTEESEREFLKVWFRAMVGDAQRNFHHRYAGRSGALAVDHPQSQ